MTSLAVLDAADEQIGIAVVQALGPDKVDRIFGTDITTELAGCALPTQQHELSGFFSKIGNVFKKVGKIIKKALPIALPFILPGIGGTIGAIFAKATPLARQALMQTVQNAVAKKAQSDPYGAQQLEQAFYQATGQQLPQMPIQLPQTVPATSFPSPLGAMQPYLPYLMAGGAALLIYVLLKD